MSRIYEDNSFAIGHTPLVKLNSITKNAKATVLAKIEGRNPAYSVKCRIGANMIWDAEKKGLLNKDKVIIEPTSGNTGIALAYTAAARGYKLILTMPESMSIERRRMMAVLGAELILTEAAKGMPGAIAKAKEIADSDPQKYFMPGQFDNPANPEIHFKTTGPEIWDQTEGKITHFVVGVGTGGTISGVGKYLKQKNPNIKIWGVDSYGSVLKKYHETGEFDKSEIYPYETEGIGEDMLPENVNFEIIDGFTKVTDKDAAIYCRKLLKEEGMFLGNSAGAAIKGVLQLKENFNPEDLVVVLFHDHGSRYLKKIYNDDWMREMGYM